jgi:hypothetical protein
MKYSLITTFAVVSLLIFTGGAAAAVGGQAALPPAGLTPDSPFYFLDRFGETLQRLFTFKPEAKARLEITFAAERASEIKVTLETKGIDAKSIEVAQNLLQANLAQAAAIVVAQKNEGKDASALAKELSDRFTGPRAALEQTFKDRERALRDEEDKLKAKIREAKRTSESGQVETLVRELDDVKAQKELLGLRAEEQKKDLDEEEARFEEQMEVKDVAVRKIRAVEKERVEMIRETQKEGWEIPAEASVQFDNFVSQAKTALGSGKYKEAAQLAKQADRSLEDANKKMDDLAAAEEQEREEKELKQEVGDQQPEAEGDLKESGKEEHKEIKEKTERDEASSKQEQGKSGED